MQISQLMQGRTLTFVVPEKRDRFLNERAELIRMIVEGINKTPGGQKLFGYKQVGGQLKRFGIEGLRNLLQECERANNFRAYFWYKVRLSPTARLTKTA